MGLIFLVFVILALGYLLYPRLLEYILSIYTVVTTIRGPISCRASPG